MRESRDVIAWISRLHIGTPSGFLAFNWSREAQNPIPLFSRVIYYPGLRVSKILIGCPIGGRPQPYNAAHGVRQGIHWQDWVERKLATLARYLICWPVIASMLSNMTLCITVCSELILRRHYTFPSSDVNYVTLLILFFYTYAKITYMYRDIFHEEQNDMIEYIINFSAHYPCPNIFWV